MPVGLYSESRSPISQKRLWYGLTAAAAAWVVHGFTNVVISTVVCPTGAYSGPMSPGAIRAALIAINCIAFAVALSATVISYRNWRALSDHAALSDAEAPGREQFMALGGVIVGSIFLVAIFWGTLPSLLVDVCVRWR